MHRFFVSTNQIRGKTAEITGSDVNHIKHVLRLHLGTHILICDGISKTYLTRIKSINIERVELIIEKELEESSEPKIKVTLAQCLPKGSKFDFIIQKSVELGVYSIIPTLSERTVPDIKGKEKNKTERWYKIAKQAAEQSGRKIIPEVQPPMSFEEVLTLKDQYDLALLPWELEKDKQLKLAIRNREVHSQVPKLLLLIGSEGGFSQSEADKARKAGFATVSLGKRILRTETAPIAILANIFYELEQ
ncbi:16S rRNA (uracil(1498)-N(3))-methyltransferase [Candidatus Margulisiibacteriota bacterium]